MNKQTKMALDWVKRIQHITGWSIRKVEQEAGISQATLAHIVKGNCEASDTVKDKLYKLAVWCKINKGAFETIRRGK